MKPGGDSYDPHFGPVLVGMRGSGKSTLAPLLAAVLGFEAVDADAELERSAGSPIAEIFATRGEASFRRMERELLLDDLLQRPRCVLATGGGAVLHDAVRSVLCHRVTVWLRAPVPVLAGRIGGSDRPSLTGRAAAEELEDVLAAREPLYGEVSVLLVDTANYEAASLARSLAESYRALIAGEL